MDEDAVKMHLLRLAVAHLWWLSSPGAWICLDVRPAPSCHFPSISLSFAVSLFLSPRDCLFSMVVQMWFAPHFENLLSRILHSALFDRYSSPKSENWHYLRLEHTTRLLPRFLSGRVDASYWKSEPDCRYWAVRVERFHSKSCSLLREHLSIRLKKIA